MEERLNGGYGKHCIKYNPRIDALHTPTLTSINVPPNHDIFAVLLKNITS